MPIVRKPIPESYWVIEDRLLAGRYPGGRTPKEAEKRVAAFLEAGFDAFLDLTEAGELPPYDIYLPGNVQHVRKPITDHGVPAEPLLMTQILAALDTLLRQGRKVYVHCRAGIGRTGMTIGCYLREQGETAAAALAELNRLWQQNARAARWPSIPETEEQERFILDWTPHPLDQSDARDSGLHRLQLRPLDRYRGCLIGLAIGDVSATAGDAVSAPSAWSDETGTTLCVIESLLARGGFDGRDQLERYRAWARDPAAAGARSDATLRPAVREVLARAVWNKAAVLGSHDPAQQDASPLARVAAAALFAAGDRQAAIALAAAFVIQYLGAPVPVDACRLLAAMIASALQGAARGTVMTVAQHFEALPLRDELRTLAADWTGPQVGRRRPPPAILGALDRAVRAFSRSREFAGGLERALGAPPAERAAVAASYGALAGAYYGEASIPAALRGRVAGLSRLGALAEQIFQRPGAADGRLA